MKVVLAGAFGHLGADILRSLVREGHDVTAAGLTPRDLEGCSIYKAVKIDVTDAASLKGLCDGADVVISTVGLTKASTTVTPYDVDYAGNKNLIDEAIRAGVKHFAFVSVLKADKAPNVPLVDAKGRLEAYLKQTKLSWVIFRPTGYFYDIAHVFMPMIEKGKVTLLCGPAIRANVVDTPDLADFIVDHMCDENKTYDIGGKETYTYKELATLFFEAAGKEPKISYAPAWLFDVLTFVNKVKKNGRDGLIKFSKWTLTEEMVGDTKVGDHSFAEYIKGLYKK